MTPLCILFAKFKEVFLLNNFPTIKKLIKTAFIPLGHTMYVYGGGWNEEDTFASLEARTIGESSAWRNFFLTQSSSYNFKNFLHCSTLGLDCTGYIGWVIYNLLNTQDNLCGYVFKSNELGYRLEELGLGSVSECSSPLTHRCGDIFFSPKHSHAYISLGECADKSVLLLHSSPPGVILSGTPSPRYCSSRSQAQRCARKFMQANHPNWHAKFPQSDRGADYLCDYHRFRFHKLIVRDPDELSLCSAADILSVFSK